MVMKGRGRGILYVDGKEGRVQGRVEEKGCYWLMIQKEGVEGEERSRLKIRKMRERGRQNKGWGLFLDNGEDE